MLVSWVRCEGKWGERGRREREREREGGEQGERGRGEDGWIESGVARAGEVVRVRVRREAGEDW